MNTTPTSKMIAELKALCAQEKAAAALFEVFSQRQRDASVTKVERAAWLASSDYSAMVYVFKKLAEIGVGRFIPGRHGHASRMEWYFSIRSLADVAKGAGKTLEGVSADADSDDALDEALSDELISHEFFLRPGLKAVLQLPSDLSDKEVQRLSTYLGTLVI